MPLAMHVPPTHLANQESEYLTISAFPAKVQTSLVVQQCARVALAWQNKGTTTAQSSPANTPPHRTSWWCFSILAQDPQGFGTVAKPAPHAHKKQTAQQGWGQAWGSVQHGAPRKQLNTPAWGLACEPHDGSKARRSHRRAEGDFNQTLKADQQAEELHVPISKV